MVGTLEGVLPWIRPGGDVKSAGNVLDHSNTGIYICKNLPNNAIKISVLYCIIK